MSLKINAAIGFCARAGKLKSGDFAVEKALKSNKARIVILDETASDNTRKTWENACSYRSVRLLLMESPGIMAGKKDNKVFAVVDDDFAKMIVNAFDSQQLGSCENKDTDF